MSHSLRHTPILGNTTAHSEKKDKQAANRAYRRSTRQLVKAGCDPAHYRLHMEWFDKDGKSYWIPWGWAPWFHMAERFESYSRLQRK